MVRNTITCTTLALLAVAAGCQSYEREPIRLDAIDAAWRGRDPGNDSVRDFAAALARQASVQERAAPFDPADGLTLNEAEAVALVFNADLRVRRAEAAVPLVGAAKAGLWDDPVLDFDLLRILESVDDPWITGVGVGLTIPLSGRLDAERDQAWAQYGAAWRRVAQREHETLVELRRAWRRWSAAAQRAELTDEYLRRLGPIREMADRLAGAGEIRPTDARVLAMEHATQRIAARRWRDEAARLRVVLMGLMGLRPAAGVTLVAAVDSGPLSLWERAGVRDRGGDERPAIDERPPREPSPGRPPEMRGRPLPKGEVAEPALRGHPALLVALAEYESAEQALRREVLKQFPDLTIGPVYENEEGQSRIGFSGAIPLPLWNRNVRGIAEAEAQRAAARARVEQVYESLANQLAEAQVEHDAAQRRGAAIVEQVAPLVDEQLTELRQLIDAGEVDVLLLKDALDRSLTTKLDVLDAVLEASLAAESVRGLVRPRWVATAEPGAAANEQGDEQ